MKPTHGLSPCDECHIWHCPVCGCPKRPAPSAGNASADAAKAGPVLAATKARMYAAVPETLRG